LITVDGEPVNPPDASSRDDIAAKAGHAVRAYQLELKLCKALAALNPPPDLAYYLHTRIIELLRRLRANRAADAGATWPAGLSDTDLRQAASIIRAFRALPAWTERGFEGGTGRRATLGEYALDLATEIENRATTSTQPTTPP
jgi:hypothetical protein